MEKWVNLLLVITFTLTSAQLELRDHSNRCFVGCRKEPPNIGGTAYKLGKKWKCRCYADYDEEDLTGTPFTLQWIPTKSEPIRSEPDTRPERSYEEDAVFHPSSLMQWLKQIH